jgi:hypothetical protein
MILIPQSNPMLRVVFPLVLAFVFANVVQTSQAQSPRKAQKQQLATVQGVIKNDSRKKFRVSYDEIKTALRKIIIPKDPPFPANWKSMDEAGRKGWLTKFLQSERGKRFVKNREKTLNEAPSFEVKYNDKGNFVVYDVPPGDYGLQGRIDKEIEGVNYGFEVFARIKVLEDVDQIKLEPIPVTITPFFKQGQFAPPINLKSLSGESLNFDLAAYKDHFIFLNFMNTSDLTPGFQQQVQAMYKALGKSHKVKLITIVMDDITKDSAKKKTINWLKSKKITSGSFAFTNGWDDSAIEDYGVRSTPSGWLISPDAERKIVISQHEFFRLARMKPTITAIIKDRIDGKDTPTLATPEEPSKEESSEN